MKDIDLNVINGRSVFVYKNLHLSCYSIRGNRSRIVLAHARNGFVIKNALFKVSQPGRQRVLRERSKNVHAGVSGIISTDNELKNKSLLVKVTYNPYLRDSFFESESPNRSVFSASSVFFLEDGIYALGVIYNE